MKKGLIALIAIIVVLVVLVFTAYNGLVRAREGVTNSWANVEVTYQRRAELIPNLVESVKAFADHEAEVLTELTRLRAGFDEADTPEEYEQANQQLNTAISVAVEAYPELRSSALFQDLMTELSGTENRVATARRDYNQAATSYNARIRSLPARLYAGLLGFEPVQVFEATPGAETAPTVNFD
ncbi:MAG TPA: LemA family protein [Fastidiosipila sp.]|jgi:LemA protein|nr:LemA family protein [Fastidiosipila sp.]